MYQACHSFVPLLLVSLLVIFYQIERCVNLCRYLNAFASKLVTVIKNIL